MNQMKEKEFDPAKFALIAGSILMALPTFFWLGVFLQVFFETAFIVKNIMLPIDRTSPILSVMIMVGLPLIAIMINLKSMMHVRLSATHEQVGFGVSVNKNLAQWALIFYAGVSIITILTYAFFENFKIVSAHFIR